MDVELLDFLDSVNEYDYKNNLSYFRPFASKIKFSFLSKDYQESLRKYKQGRVVDDLLRIIVHEYFHLFQRVYTVFGFYNQLLERFKVGISNNMARYILSEFGGNVKINAPLSDMIKKNQVLIDDNRLTRLLFNWLDSDLVYSYINKNYFDYLDKYDSYNKKELRFDNSFLVNNFFNLEKELFDYQKYVFNASFSDFYVDYDRDMQIVLNAEIRNAQNKITNIFPSMNGILESYSKAAELYLIKEEFDVKGLQRPISAKEQDYYLPLLIASKYILTTNPTEFLLTYLAVCDIALSPPVLPSLSKLRNKNWSIESFDPSYRFYLLLIVQEKIRPVKNLEDCKRYIDEICELLKWPTPHNVAKEIVNDFNPFDGDIESEIFLFSQKNRIVSPCFYLDIESFLIYLYDNLTYCPITEFSDTVFINHTLGKELPDAEVYFIIGYLRNQFWGSVLTRIPSVLYFPYRVDSPVIKIYSDFFCSMNRDVFDFKKTKFCLLIIVYSNMYNNMSPNEILKIVEEKLKSNPSDEESIYYKGIALSDLRQSKDALCCFDQLLVNHKKHAGLWYQKGVVLNDLGLYEEAKDCFKEALSIDPYFSEAFNNVAFSLIRLNRQEEALHYVEKALEINRDNFEAWINKASLLDDTKRYKEALVCINYILSKYHDNEVAFYIKGNILRSMSRDVEAIDAYENALRVNKNYYDAHNNKGLICKKIGRLHDAIRAFDNAILINKRDPSAWNNKGLVLRMLGDHNRAIKCFREAKTLGDGNAAKNLKMFYGE